MSSIIEPNWQLHEKLLQRLVLFQRLSLAAIFLIAGAILIAWLILPLRHIFPAGWDLMKANTALSFLLGSSVMFLIRQQAIARHWIWIGLCLAGLFCLSGTALLGHLTGRLYWVETLLAADKGAEMPGRMSIQTSLYLLVLALVMTLICLGGKLRTIIVDINILILFVIILIIVSGYTFDASYLFGHSPHTRTSPQTLICMVLLGYALFVHRCQDGLFRVFIGRTIGGRIARALVPISLLIPFLIVSVGAYVLYRGWITQPYVAAMSAALSSALSFIIILIMGRRINDMERELRDISLTDELTRIYNRRAFYMLGEFTLKGLQRAPRPLSVLFFDIDGLKQANDNFGHDTGSQLLQDFAMLLRENFRSNDIIARLGGDEFAIITHTRGDEVTRLLQRLSEAVDEKNRLGQRPYLISYTVGVADLESSATPDFRELVNRADAAMYRRKHSKRSGRGNGGRALALERRGARG